MAKRLRIPNEYGELPELVLSRDIQIAIQGGDYENRKYFTQQLTSLLKEELGDGITFAFIDPYSPEDFEPVMEQLLSVQQGRKNCREIMGGLPIIPDLNNEDLYRVVAVFYELSETLDTIPLAFPESTERRLKKHIRDSINTYIRDCHHLNMGYILVSEDFKSNEPLDPEVRDSLIRTRFNLTSERGEYAYHDGKKNSQWLHCKLPELMN